MAIKQPDDQITYRQRLHKKHAPPEGTASRFQPTTSLRSNLAEQKEPEKGVPSDAEVRATADMLAALPEEEYCQGLESLREHNPAYYERVVDVLNNMNAESPPTGDLTDPGDGHDLSALVAPQLAPSQINAADDLGVVPDGPGCDTPQEHPRLAPTEMALLLTTVSGDEYTQSLRDMEASDPAYYELVTAELIRLNNLAQAGDSTNE